MVKKANSSDQYTHLSNVRLGTEDGGGNIAFAGTSGTGMKLGVGEDADLAFGWEDITGPIETRGVGATDPDWEAIGGTVQSAFRFLLNHECWIPFHIPHDYAPGTDIYFHVHWLCSGTDTTNKVKWQFDYMYAKGHNQEAFPLGALPSPVTCEEASGAQYQHMVTETSAVTIAGLEVDGIVYVRLKRIANGATDVTDPVFVLTSDVHYQSTNMSTPNRAPNFYNV